MKPGDPDFGTSKVSMREPIWSTNPDDLVVIKRRLMRRSPFRRVVTFWLIVTLAALGSLLDFCLIFLICLPTFFPALFLQEYWTEMRPLLKA